MFKSGDILVVIPMDPDDPEALAHAGERCQFDRFVDGLRSFAPNFLAALKNIHHLTYESGWLDSLLKIREVAASAIEKAETQ